MQVPAFLLNEVTQCFLAAGRIRQDGNRNRKTCISTSLHQSAAEGCDLSFSLMHLFIIARHARRLHQSRPLTLHGRNRRFT